MRFSLFLATIGALAGSALAAPQTILVEAQIVELTTNDPEPPKDLSRLTEEKGADVLTFSTLETPSGKPATLSATRRFTVPDKDTFETGVVLTVCPAFTEDHRVQYSVDFDATEFLGYAADSSSPAPMFSTNKTIGIEGATDFGKPVLLDLRTLRDEQTIQEPGKPDHTATIYRRTFAILRFSKGVE